MSVGARASSESSPRGGARPGSLRWLLAGLGSSHAVGQRSPSIPDQLGFSIWQLASSEPPRWMSQSSITDFGSNSLSLLWLETSHWAAHPQGEGTTQWTPGRGTVGAILEVSQPIAGALDARLLDIHRHSPEPQPKSHTSSNS